MEQKKNLIEKKNFNYVNRRTYWDSSTAIASFFLGVAFVLIVFVIFLFGFGFILSVFLALLLLLFFLMITILIVRPRKVVKVIKRPIVEVKTEQSKEEKAKNFVGSSETKTYHKQNCRFAKLIKPNFRDYSDDISFFKKRKYKPCKVCMKK